MHFTAHALTLRRPHGAHAQIIHVSCVIMAECSSFPSLSRREIIDCSIQVWNPQFSNLTFKSVFVPLSLEFVEYLKSDGVFLPQGCSLAMNTDASREPSEHDCTEDQSNWSDTDSNGSSSSENKPCFPELVEKIESAIAVLGGRVVPKLNWSTPKDAAWLLPGNSLQCRSPGEVILLLKSSDFVAHDLIHVFDECSDKDGPPIDYTLCVREWADIHPSSEFRCFVRKHLLIAVSQRDCSSCHGDLVSHKDEVRQDIVHFFQQHIRHRHPHPNYVFDVWRASEGDVRLVDFNPFTRSTDPLLFSWEELAGGTSPNEGETPRDSPMIRVVEEGESIQPHPLEDFRYPQDVLDLARGDDIHKFIDFLRLGEDNNEESDSS